MNYPSQGSGISGVTLIQDSSAKAQIEALKALASEVPFRFHIVVFFHFETDPAHSYLG